MITANRQRVTVATYNPDIQRRVGDLDACCYCSGAAMNRVKAVCCHVIRKSGCTADTRYKNRLIRVHTQSRHGFLHRLQYGVVATARTPSNFLIGCVVLWFEADFYWSIHVFFNQARCSDIDCSSSEMRNGWPDTLLMPMAGTANSARRSFTSCPSFISGTRIV